MNKAAALISIVICALLMTACEDSQIEKANALVAAANQNIAEADELIKHAEKRNMQLFSVNIRTTEELQDYRRKMHGEAQTIIEEFGKVSDLAGEASSKFAEASRLNVPQKFKEYLATKAEEFAKRAAAVTARKGNAQAFLDFSDSAMVKKFEENNEKSEKLLDEARELGEQADGIRQENEEIFNSWGSSGRNY